MTAYNCYSSTVQYSVICAVTSVICPLLSFLVPKNAFLQKLISVVQN